MPKRKTWPNKRETESWMKFFNDKRPPEKRCVCQEGEMCWLVNPREDGMGLAAIRGWRAIGFLHSFSDQLFHKAGDPSATSHGVIAFAALGREKRGWFSSPCSNRSHLANDSRRPALSHVPTLDKCHGQRVRYPWTGVPFWVRELCHHCQHLLIASFVPGPRSPSFPSKVRVMNTESVRYL